MTNTIFPPAAVHAGVPDTIRLQICSSCEMPPEDDGWLHEIKHDGHRLLVVVSGPGKLKLISRNGHDVTEKFRAPFEVLAATGCPLVLDGEIAVPDESGLTHLDWLHNAMSGRRSERLAYFAFDLLYLDGLDLRRCAIEHRKGLLHQLLPHPGSSRLVAVDHVIGGGMELFEAVRALGTEGIVSKRLGRPYVAGASVDWLKTKVHQTQPFAVVGFEGKDGRLDAVHVAVATCRL